MYANAGKDERSVYEIEEEIEQDDEWESDRKRTVIARGSSDVGDGKR